MSSAQRGCSLVHCSLRLHSLTLSRVLRTSQIPIKNPMRSKRVRERRVNSEQVNIGEVRQ
jgi:hypothetical protein